MATKNKYTNVPKVEEVQKNQFDESGTFMIVNVEDKWRIGVAGRWVTKETFETPEAAQKYIDQKPWDILMNAMAIMAEFMYKEMSNQNK